MCNKPILRCEHAEHVEDLTAGAIGCISVSTPVPYSRRLPEPTSDVGKQRLHWVSREREREREKFFTGNTKVTEGVSGQSFNSGHGIHAPHIRSVSNSSELW